MRFITWNPHNGLARSNWKINTHISVPHSTFTIYNTAQYCTNEFICYLLKWNHLFTPDTINQSSIRCGEGMSKKCYMNLFWIIDFLHASEWCVGLHCIVFGFMWQYVSGTLINWIPERKTAMWGTVNVHKLVEYIRKYWFFVLDQDGHWRGWIK